MRKIKKYFVNEEDSAVLAMSLVEEPAIESNFIALQKEEDKTYVALQSEDKHLIYGAALRPDFPIYRNDGVEEYYIEFSKEAVEKLSRDFLKNGFQGNFTQAHKNEIEGVTVAESWIKMDMEKDKSIALGLDPALPVGTWFLGSYCNNAEVWEKVKKGEFRGYSVEAVCSIGEQEFEAQEQVMEDANTTTATIEEPTVEVKESVLEKILSYLTPSFDKKEANVSESGEIKVNEEEGLVEVEKEEVKEDVNSESDGNGDSDNSDNADEQVSEEVNPLQDVVDNLKNELEELKKTNEGLLEKIKELGSQPSAKPINTNPKGTATSSDNAFRNWRDTMRNLVN